ncbi:MAG: LAGLIDADG family homing endonuclease [Candidatus Portnoybacteria bacterium]|nr:LAGLIDADG family homing endonuclease [Candidatus Portnoybacteria bacterium]
MPSKKSTSVPFKEEAPDNPQERLKTIGWIVGYVDGEGCFSVTMIRNARTKFGWQVFPEFVVTQGEKSLNSLKMIQNFFECGKIFINRRHDNHKEPLFRYCVRSISDLNAKIIPFFEKNNLKTAKEKDFKVFAKIVKMMISQRHFKYRGMKKIAGLMEKINRCKPSKFLESPETIRQTPQITEKI